jgi:energy-coupling factor transport system ATP-binding protein
MAELLGSLGEIEPDTAPSEVPRLGLPSGSRRGVVRAEGLRYRYPGGREAVRGIDLTVTEGEYVGLIGQNGAGKSTLARLLAGLLRPERGEVMLGGRPLGRLSRREIVAHVGYVFQNPDFQFFSRTCLEEVAFGLRLRGLPEADAGRRAAAALESLGVGDYRDEHPHFLSRGQRRRVAIASVLALEPRGIVLDEPTTGLDVGTATHLLDVVDGLRERGHAIVMLTHEMRAVLERCDRLVLVRDGRVELDDDPRRAFKERGLLESCGIQPPPLAELVEGLPWCSTPLLPRTSREAAALMSGVRRPERRTIGGTA